MSVPSLLAHVFIALLFVFICCDVTSLLHVWECEMIWPGILSSFTLGRAWSYLPVLSMWKVLLIRASAHT